MVSGFGGTIAGKGDQTPGHEGLEWSKASRSAQGNCVEVAAEAGVVHMRDSKRIELGVMTFTSDLWRQFVEQAKTSIATGVDVNAGDIAAESSVADSLGAAR
jgi:hypothetical protein